MNGPVPTGFWLMSAALPDFISESAYSADRIDAYSIARFWMNGALTSFSVNLTVYGSTFSTFVISLSSPMSLKYGNCTGYALRNGWFGSSMRWNVNTTSSALNSRVGLNQDVVWNLTPWRRWNVYVLPSGETSHFSARPGSTFVPPRSNSTRRLYTVNVFAVKSVPVVYWAGSKPAGLPSEQYTSVLFGMAAFAAVAAKSVAVTTAPASAEPRTARNRLFLFMFPPSQCRLLAGVARVYLIAPPVFRRVCAKSGA